MFGPNIKDKSLMVGKTKKGKHSSWLRSGKIVLVADLWILSSLPSSKSDKIENHSGAAYKIIERILAIKNLFKPSEFIPNFPSCLKR